MIHYVLRLAIDRRVTNSIPEDAPAPGLLQPYPFMLVHDSSIIQLVGWLSDTVSSVAKKGGQGDNPSQAVPEQKGSMIFLTNKGLKVSARQTRAPQFPPKSEGVGRKLRPIPYEVNEPQNGSGWIFFILFSFHVGPNFLSHLLSPTMPDAAE